MPGRPPGNVGKGSSLAKVDAVCNGERRHEFLEALKNWQQDYLQVLMRYAGTTASEADYLREYWYDPNWADPTSECWWREKQPIEPIVRQSLIKALELALERNLPIDTYWICAGDEFKIIITCSAQQITRIVLTAPIPYDASTHPSKAPIWVVRGYENPEGVVQDVDQRDQVLVVTTRLHPLT